MFPRNIVRSKHDFPIGFRLPLHRNVDFGPYFVIRFPTSPNKIELLAQNNSNGEKYEVGSKIMFVNITNFRVFFIIASDI